MPPKDKRVLLFCSVGFCSTQCLWSDWGSQPLAGSSWIGRTEMTNHGSHEGGGQSSPTAANLPARALPVAPNWGLVSGCALVHQEPRSIQRLSPSITLSAMQTRKTGRKYLRGNLMGP